MIYVYGLQGLQGKDYIKPGHTKKIEQRQEAYKTHNPFAKLIFAVETPSKQIDLQLEWCFKVKYGLASVVNNTEWIEIVNKEDFTALHSIKTYQQLKDFVNFEEVTRQSVAYYMNMAEKEESPPSTRRRNLARAQHFEEMLIQEEE